MTVFIGIDPGKSGAISVISPSNIGFQDCPLVSVSKTKTQINVHAIANFLKGVVGNTPQETFAVLEKVGAMPGQGVTSMFSFGQSYGQYQMALAALEIPHEFVTPQRWKKSMMAGQPKDKDASRQVALRLFPKCAEDLKLKKHHGRADALLMAEYGRRIYSQGAA